MCFTTIYVEAMKMWDQFDITQELKVGSKDEWIRANLLSIDSILNLLWREVFYGL